MKKNKIKRIFLVLFMSSLLWYGVGVLKGYYLINYNPLIELHMKQRIRKQADFEPAYLGNDKNIEIHIKQRLDNLLLIYFTYGDSNYQGYALYEKGSHLSYRYDYGGFSLGNSGVRFKTIETNEGLYIVFLGHNHQHLSSFEYEVDGVIYRKDVPEDEDHLIFVHKLNGVEEFEIPSISAYFTE